MEATLPNPAADLDVEGIAVVGEEEDIEEEDAVVGEEEDIETSRSSQLEEEEEEEEEDSTNHSHVVDVEPNLEEIDEEEVLKLLEVDKNYGLSSSEAARRLQIYGPNNIRPLPEYEDTRFRRLVNRLLLCFDWDHVVPEEKIMARILLNPVSWTMLSAAVAAIAVSAVGGQMLYFYEGMAVLGLLLLNFVVCLVAKCRAQRAKMPLMEVLALKTRVLRDGKWGEEDPKNLVPGDIIFLKCGDIVPANARVFHYMDMEALTGKWRLGRYGSIIYYRSEITRGEGLAVVIATGRGMSMKYVFMKAVDFGRPGQLRKGVAAAGTFCFVLIILGTIVELIVTAAREHGFRSMLYNHLILLIGGIPMAMPAVLYLALTIGSRRFSQLQVASRGTVAVEDLAALDVILLSMTGTLTCNKPQFDRSMIKVFAEDVDVEDVILEASRASKTNYQLSREPIDAAIVNMLKDPKQARAGIEEADYASFQFTRKVSILTYLENGQGYNACKGDPEKVVGMCRCSSEFEAKVNGMLDQLALDGYQAIAVARQELPDWPAGLGNRWQFMGLIPFKDPLRDDSAQSMDSLIDMGLRITVLTGSHLPITRAVCGKLGKLGNKVSSKRDVHLDDSFMSKDVGICDVPPADKFHMVNLMKLESLRCAMVGGGMYDNLALEESDIAISSDGANDKARSDSDLVVAKPGISSVVGAIEVSRFICHVMKSYVIYSISSTVHILGVLIVSLVWKFDFSSLLILIIAISNYCTGGLLLLERSKLSKSPKKFRVKLIVATGVAFGGYIVLSTVLFLWALRSTSFFLDVFKVRSLIGDNDSIRAAAYLQMSIVNQAVIFFAWSSKRCLTDRPGLPIVCSFVVAQVVATLISVYADWNIALVKGVGWGWAGVIWLYNIFLLLALALMKFPCCTVGMKAWSYLQKKVIMKRAVQD